MQWPSSGAQITCCHKQLSRRLWLGSGNSEWEKKKRRKTQKVIVIVGLQTKEWIRADWWWASGWLHWWADFFFFSLSQKHPWTKCSRGQGVQKRGRPARGKMSTWCEHPVPWWLVCSDSEFRLNLFISFRVSHVNAPFARSSTHYLSSATSHADAVAAATRGSCHYCDDFFALVGGDESAAHYFFMTLSLILLLKCLIDCIVTSLTVI